MVSWCLELWSPAVKNQSLFPLSDITTCFLDYCHLGCECVVWHKGADALEEPAVSVFSLDVVPLNVETFHQY